MEVILRESIGGLGDTGDIVKVADGYARNYLIPKELALKPTEANRQRIEKEREALETQAAAALGELQQLANKLATASCTVPVKVGEEGQMYGSVSPQDIAQALKDEEFDIDPKSISLEDPIKELGVYTFTVQLATDVTATSKVWVVEG